MKKFKVSQEKLEGLKKLSPSELFQVWGEWLEFPKERLDHIEQDEISITIVDRGINEGSYNCDGTTMFYATPSIKEVKKELGFTNEDIASLFQMSKPVFENSSAKERYEDAVCSLYAFAKKRWGEKNNKITSSDSD